jgi:hypothetical protein
VWKHIEPTSTNLPCGLTILLFISSQSRTVRIYPEERARYIAIALEAKNVSEERMLLIKGDTLVRLLSGDHSVEATPVPIPNTEVKLNRADGTATVGE